VVVVAQCKVYTKPTLGNRGVARDPQYLEISDECIGVVSFGRVMMGMLTMPGGRAQPVAVKQLPALSLAEQRTQQDRELKAHIAAARHVREAAPALRRSQKV